jgi:hypothetical protein
MSASTSPDYRFYFDKKKDTWVCSVHGEVDFVGWVPCYASCDEGWRDDYEDDPINCDEGEFSVCPECRGEGGWKVCGECAKDNPDVEF